MSETEDDPIDPQGPEGSPAEDGWAEVGRAWAEAAGPEPDPGSAPSMGQGDHDGVEGAADSSEPESLDPLPLHEPEPEVIVDTPVLVEPEPAPEPAAPPPPPPGKPRREKRSFRPYPIPPRRKRSLLSTLVRWVAALILIFGVVGPIVVVAAYRVIPPPITYLMVQRMAEGRGFERRWVPLRRISPNLVRAVIAAEDAKFCEHDGFDFEAMQKALRNNERRPGRIRGGSTISQQTAKNVFLWPGRSYVRKGLEAWFTLLIEGLWGKERIMEVYLNSIEWGPGVYGAEAAARRNFGVSAAKLTNAQAARLAAIVPKPLSWKAAKPGPYVKRRSGKIGAAAGTVRREGLASCVLD